jgi:hypothetical protein
MGGYLNHLIAIRAVQASLQDLRLTLEEVLGKSETADYD